MICDDFWSHVDRSAGADGCWPWQRAIIRSGYGCLWVDGRSVGAHRYAYELVNGPIVRGPGYHGFVVMHSCDNRRCCNPAHLRLGTQADNNADRDAKGRADDRPRGEASATARFSDREIARVRQLHSHGASYRAIIRDVGMSLTHVARVVRGESRVP